MSSEAEETVNVRYENSRQRRMRLMRAKRHKVIHREMDAKEIQIYEKLVSGARQMTMEEYLALVTEQTVATAGERKGKQRNAKKDTSACKTGAGKRK